MSSYIDRHIGSNEATQKEMLKALGLLSLGELVGKAIPKNIQSSFNDSWDSCSEYELLAHLQQEANNNQLFRSYLGQGYYNTITPSVILRNVLENPGWYTAYTPYQPEISQGRLEALYYYQSMVSDLCGLPIANASLLDEGSAAAEAMHMFYAKKNKGRAKANTFLVSNNCFAQTISVLKTRAMPYGINLVVADVADFVFNEDVFGVLWQYPGEQGDVVNHEKMILDAKNRGIYTAVATDLLALCLLKSPGELGADVALGSAQRFGVPLGFGGPHAAFFATTDTFKRLIPGRLIGLSQDTLGDPCYRLALQVREQHIRREKATSNICTAQALLAMVSVFYAMYHGPDGLKSIAQRIYDYSHHLAHVLTEKGYPLVHETFFDTVCVVIGEDLTPIKAKAEALGINLRYGDNTVLISMDETIDDMAFNQLLSIFGINKKRDEVKTRAILPPSMVRQSTYLQHNVFHDCHSETSMMRYLKNLENKDLSLVHSMIPLGSCTMKLNAATALMPITWPAFSAIHPFVPRKQVKGYLNIIATLEQMLNDLTGFAHTCFMPNSGAQGEYAGLLVIRAYQAKANEAHRNIALIPDSAHGTNPASAQMAGLKVVSVACLRNGDINLADLRQKAQQHAAQLSCLMLTYPSTHGVFEENIKDVCAMIHQYGGQVYMDGANMNAMMGLIKPHDLGVDVCHLNLHKTFCIPHGGGGPGMGPILMAAHLKPFSPAFATTNAKDAIGAVASAPFSSASILLISYAYMKLSGLNGLKKCSEMAILHANYIRCRLEKAYSVLFTGKNGFVAHELIIDCGHYQGIKVEDIAKRLIDYGFHPPTMSWPVPETLMIEPTESESKAEIDRFCDAMLSIHQDIIRAIESHDTTIFKHAPHTLKQIMLTPWPYRYSKMHAAYPLPYLVQQKIWPSVARVDHAYGDKNLVCSCFYATDTRPLRRV